MTVGVYGLVAGIVKLDDLGLHLSKRTGPARRLGALILRGAPYLMKFLSVAGTVAMFLVGGNILVHGMPFLHHFIEPYTRAPTGSLLSMLFSAVVGLVAGALLVLVFNLVNRLRGKPQAA